MAPTTHGLSKTPAYRAWSRMRDRCKNPNVSGFHKYGARGVRICERWDIEKGGSFENFLSDMGQPPSAEHQLDKDIKGVLGV